MDNQTVQPNPVLPIVPPAEPTTPITPPPPIAPPVANVNPQPVMPPKKSFNWLFILLVFLLLAATGAYYYYFANLSKSTTQQLSQTPTVMPKPSPTTSPTANWKTYANEKCKFSLQYPENWAVNAWPVEINSVPKNVCSVNFGKYQLPATREGDTELKKLGYLIEVWGEKGADFEKATSENDIYKNRANYKREKVTFNDLPAYRITGTGMDFPRDRLMVAKDGIVYSISVNYLLTENNQRDEVQKAFNQILSTFKFTDQTSAEGKFCGGIAGKLPQNQCPAGYKCQSDGNYPDAGGKCVKN